MPCLAQEPAKPQPANFSGLWRYSNDKSQRGSQAVILEIKQDGVNVHVKEREEYESGEKLSETSFFTDGRPSEQKMMEEIASPTGSNPKDTLLKTTTTKAKWKGKNLVVEAKIFYGPLKYYYIIATWSLSEDGNNLLIKKEYLDQQFVFAQVQMTLVRANTPEDHTTLKKRKAQ